MDNNFGFDHFSSFIGSDNKRRKIEDLKNYLEEIKVKNITVVDEIDIGDIVKLKNRDYNVVVKFKDYISKSGIKSDFAGKKTNSEDQEYLVIFDRYEIEKIIQKKIKRRKDNEKDTR